MSNTNSPAVVPTIPKSQLEDLKAVFDFIDTDSSGTIELHELWSAFKRMDPALNLTEEELNVFFRKLDTTGTQHVSFDTFVKMMLKYIPNLTIEKKHPTPPKPPSLDDILEEDVKIPQLRDWCGQLKEYTNPLNYNPYQFNSKNFVQPGERVIEKAVVNLDKPEKPRKFLRAGARKTIVFDPEHTKAAIVTCGGLCPGLNTVIREFVLCLTCNYGVQEIYGIQYGYRGFYAYDYLPLSPNSVSGIHNKGGTILGSSRGGFDTKMIVDSLEKKGINQLYVIGGDGTHRGATVLFEEIVKRKLKISIACVPKTIDNDFQLLDLSFGFLSAIDEAQKAIKSATVEAEGAVHGIGLVKLMGRQSGFIAMMASLASRDVDYCLIPEVPFHMLTLLRHMKRKLQEKGRHAYSKY